MLREVQPKAWFFGLFGAKCALKAESHSKFDCSIPRKIDSFTWKIGLVNSYPS